MDTRNAGSPIIERDVKRTEFSINFSTAVAENVDKVSMNQPEQTVELSADKSLEELCTGAEEFVDVPLEVEMSNGTATISILDILNAKPIKSHQRASKPKEERPQQNCTQVVFNKCPEFQKTMVESNMPKQNVREWTSEHVRVWLKWAKLHYDIQELNVEDVVLTGAAIMEQEVKSTMESLGVTDSLFCTHIVILRHTNRVTIPTSQTTVPNVAVDPEVLSSLGMGKGTIQLWQLLLELLLDKKYKNCITWEEKNARDGTFLIKDPAMVAQLWGKKKNKSNITYSSVSKSMGYYCEKKILKKVEEKNCCYRFVYDFQQMIGYSVIEMQEMLENETEFTKSLLQQIKAMLQKPDGVKNIFQVSKSV